MPIGPAEADAGDAGRDAPGGGALRGRVERFDAEAGIAGWAADGARPFEPLAIRLVAGGHLLAATTACLDREDVAAAEGLASSAVGFRLDPAVLARFRDLPDRLDDSRPEILAGPGAVALPADAPVPTVAACRALAEAGGGAGGGADPAGGPVPHAAALSARLDGLVAAARARLPAARLAGARPCGFLEGSLRIDHDTYALCGWMDAAGPAAFPAVLAADRKWPAGLALVRFPRADLPPGAAGFVGLLRTAMPEAPPALTVPVGLIGGDGVGVLTPAAGAAPATRAQLAALLDAQDPAGDPGLHRALRDTIALAPGWTPTAPGDGFAAHLDRILVVPGFGLFAQGWMLGAAGRPALVELRAGDAVLRAAPADIRRLPRPDLQGAFPGAAPEDCLSAGFLACLRGTADRSDLGDLRLRVTCDDGTRHVHALAPQSVGTVAEAGAIERLHALNPRLPAEPWFPALRAALRAGLAAALRPADPPLPEAEAALFVAFGPWPQDVAVLMHALAARAAAWPAGALVVALVDPAAPRATVEAWADRLGAAGIAGVHLVAARAGHALPAAAAAMPARPIRRIAVLGPGAVPRPAGWAAIAAHLAAAGDEPAAVVLGEAGAGAEGPFGGLLWGGGALRLWTAIAGPRFGQDYLARLVAEGTATAAPGMLRLAARGRPAGILRRLDADADAGAAP